ncbi:hypothetical protein NDU88_002989 [Pleurodeles waltl]|uniref:Uncharacterized protein n=1 Tax=Pleurodeles waltl TaxID=8319 RepID=A0AAV7VFD6_PLEWA|nr:hypothetical protein NDU88_002989 [Pleurodeles waltl]
MESAQGTQQLSVYSLTADAQQTLLGDRVYRCTPGVETTTGVLSRGKLERKENPVMWYHGSLRRSLSLETGLSGKCHAEVHRALIVQLPRGDAKWLEFDACRNEQRNMSFKAGLR